MSYATAIAMGVMAVGGAILGRRAENKQALRDAKAFGVRSAGIAFSADRKLYAESMQMAFAHAEHVKYRIEVMKAQQRAESDAKVEAATAGVAGQSVDLTINDTMRSRNEALSSLDQRLRSEKLQLSTDIVDTHLNAALQTGTMETRSKSSKDVALSYALSFGEGFVSGGGLKRGGGD